MKIIKKIIAIISLVFPFLFLSSFKVNSFSKPLDEISNYIITINPCDDGSLDMEYSITWKVLDSTSEGPLSWVKIGVPNCYVSNLKGLTNNIKDISYYDDGGAYIKIVFNTNYYENQILTFNFSFHQERIYTISNNYCYYSFTPGWFEEINVKNLLINWKKDGLEEAPNDYKYISGDYYVFQTSLAYGNKYNINLKYATSYFPNLDYNKQYSSRYLTNKSIILIGVVICIIIIVIIALIIIGKLFTDPYMSHRGFTGNYLYYHTHVYPFFTHHYSGKGKEIINPNSSSSNGGYHGGGHSCACACACAGGGRAGCSLKDFYSTKISKIRKSLSKNG